MVVEERKQLTVRLDAEVHARLGRVAEQEHRSKHAQILHYIERGLATDVPERDDG